MNDVPYPDVYFSRQDESDDALFYASARKVVHIDDSAIALLRDSIFAKTLPARASILDLMSSWRSHLPPALSPLHVVGVGMNAEEMTDNPQLSEYRVHDLNADPTLDFADATFDAAVCTVSVQYLTRPLEVFREVRRVLKPGGAFVVSFSNRCFPPKAIWVWLYTDDEKHQALVSDYFRRVGFVRLAVKAYTPQSGDPLFVVTGYKAKR